jgi:hypothetical protein
MTTPRARRPRPTLRLEPLEAREVPATLVSPTTVTYQDADGDTVRVVFSRPFLTDANVNAVFSLDTGTVDGDNTVKQQLQRIDLAAVGPAAAGTSVTVTALRSPANGGDGFAAVGHIVATGIDLGAVTIDGDLGRVLAGDAATSTSGLNGLTVHSMGRFGTSTGAPDLGTVIQGRLNFLKVKSDVREASVLVQGGAAGRLGSVTIGGSLIGGARLGSGRIFSDGALGPVRIVGNVQGGGDESGEVFTNSTLAGVTIGGSLLGGAGSRSGRINSFGGMGAVRIAGTVQGAGGTLSGSISTSGPLAGLTIGGSLVGGAGSFSGRISSEGAVGPVRVAGAVQGGGGSESGAIIAFTTLAGVTIGGSLVGGAGSFSGRILSVGALGTVRIAGDLVGGSASGTVALRDSGSVRGGRIARITLGGSLIAGTDNTIRLFANNGAIRADDDIGSVLIKGSVVGNSTNPAIISARGKAAPTPTSDVAIGSLRVLGRVELAQIQAGVDATGAARNADAQIGVVSVGGDWVASSIAAGAVSGNGLFGDTGDARMTGVGIKDDSLVVSKIARLTVGGQVLGTIGGADHYGIVAEVIGPVTVGGTLIPTTPGPSNDDFFVGITGDFAVNEV